MTIHEASAETLIELTSQGLTFVYFHDPWYPPSRALLPWLEALAAELDGRMRFVRADFYEFHEIMRAHQICFAPASFIIERDQRSGALVVYQKQAGAFKGDLRRMIARSLDARGARQARPLSPEARPR